MDRPARFRRSEYKIELIEGKGKPGERVGTPQVSHRQDRAERENKHDGTRQHKQHIQSSHGGARLRDINHKEYSQICWNQTGELSKMELEDPRSLVYVNKDVVDVLNGWVGPVPEVTDCAAPDPPTNLVVIRLWKRACETLFFVVDLVTSGPATT